MFFDYGRAKKCFQLTKRQGKIKLHPTFFGLAISIRCQPKTLMFNIVGKDVPTFPYLMPF